MSSPFSRVRKEVRRILLGPADLPQQFPVGIEDPQPEVSVWLEGSGIHQDVTINHVMVCAAPFTIAVGWEGLPVVDRGAPLTLSFHERQGNQRLLGTIGLRFSGSIPMPGYEILLFTSRNCRICCLPRGRVWACNLFYAYLRWRQPPEVPVTWRDANSTVVFFLCPRPVALASVGNLSAGNIFPLNLMGTVGKDYFAFALNRARPVTSFVERQGYLAVSSIPLDRRGLVRELGKNHRTERIDWTQLRFPLKPSAPFDIPVPEFAQRVRIVRIERTQGLGSHTLFVGRIVEDQRYSDAKEEFFVVHGLYEAGRRQAPR